MSFRFELGDKVRTYQDDVGTITERRRHESFYTAAEITYRVSLPGSPSVLFREEQLQPYRCKCPDCIDERHREQVEEKVHFLMVNLGDGKQFENLLFKFAKEMLEMEREPATEFKVGDKVRTRKIGAVGEIISVAPRYSIKLRNGETSIEWTGDELEVAEEAE